MARRLSDWSKRMFSPTPPLRRHATPDGIRPNLEELEERWMPTGYVVNSTLDILGDTVAGQVTLRDVLTAISSQTASGQAAAGTASNTITFAIPGLRSEAIQPVGINITKDGKTAFVALGPANRVAVIDAVTHEVKKYLLVGQRVWHMAFTPDERYLLTTNGVSNDISVIDVANLKVIKSIQVGELPWGVAISQH